MRTSSLFPLAGALLLSAGIGRADSISPSSYSTTLGVGESVTITKTVTVDAGAASSSKVDVFFLADETGSMGSYINSVRTSASTILSNAAGLGDVAFGVGGYQDNYDTFIYRQWQDMTTNTTAAQTGINNWAARGGGDWEEANLYALQQVATTTTWRAGSERLVVWFGDAPGHDPSGPTGVTQAQAIAALNAAGISVLAVDVGSLNYYGQASAIATATGGHYYSGINSGSIVATIQSAITTAVSTYTTVGLDISEVPAGVSVSYTPGSYTGAYDRSVSRTFDFDVTFTGVAAGTYDFAIYGTVDRGRVAAELDTIVVGEGGPIGVPDGGATVVLLGLALSVIGLVRRKMA